MEIIYGIVTKVTYYDDTKGFGIVKIKLDYKDKEMVKFRPLLFSNTVSVLSSFDRCPILDEEFEFTGSFEVTNYGIQFKAKTFKRRNEQSQEGIITYLSSDFFPGIGKVIATKVYEALGNDAIKIIADDRKALDKIDITDKQKVIIYDNIILHKKNEKELLQLLEIGISMRIANQILKSLGSNAYDKICENPYLLMDEVEGIGFFRADQIARKIGISEDNPFRLQAIIIYVFNNYIYSSGNTYMDINDLYRSVLQITNEQKEIVNEDSYVGLLKNLINDNKIKIENNKYVHNAKIYDDEYEVAKNVYAFLKGQNQVDTNKDIETVLNKVMEINNIVYTPKQKEAIIRALREPITIITGGPGTGKSTIIKGIVDTYANLFKNPEIVKERIALCAPTGRAAKRMSEVTKHRAQTIHKLLGYEGKGYFSVTKEEPLDFDLVVIDEFSMVDISLASYLLSCIRKDAKIIIVGDSNQLPSVAPGNVLKDLIESKEITTIKLEQIHRQAHNSTIVDLAHNVNKGILLYDVMENKSDRKFISSDDLHIKEIIAWVISEKLKEGFDIHKDIQVLIPLYKGDIGIEAVNYYLQDYFNNTPEEVNVNGKRFRTNDKVIQLNNRTEKQVMNGDLGYILTINKDREEFKSLTVMFDVGAVDYTKDELDDLALAYAISIHKSQGSEFPIVIMPFSFKYYILLKRKLIYTGITRAKQELYIIGNYEALRRGIVELEEERKTKLVERIKEVFQLETKKSNLENISPYDFL